MLLNSADIIPLVNKHCTIHVRTLNPTDFFKHDINIGIKDFY